MMMLTTVFVSLFIIGGFAKSVLKDDKFGKYKIYNSPQSMIIDGDAGIMPADKFHPTVIVLSESPASSEHVFEQAPLPPNVRLVSGETDRDVIEPPPQLPPRAVPLPSDLKTFFASLPENVESERIVVGDSLSAPASIVYDDSVDPFEADHRLFVAE